MVRYGVVIPTYNEAGYVGRTIRSIAKQLDNHGQPYPSGTLHVVVVDRPGRDGTPAAASAAAADCPRVTCTILVEPEPSMVAARRAGIEFLRTHSDEPVDQIVSMDADTLLPPGWLAAVGAKVDEGYELVSTAGFFEPELWLRCPTLTRRYAEHVGTLFFPPAITRQAVCDSDRPLFTEQVFRDFGRPVSDCAMLIRTALYERLGGFRDEYWDAEQAREIPAVGWPFMFRADMAGVAVGYVERPSYETSARRLLHEPEALFSGSSYLAEIANFRSQSADRYAWLEHFAPQLDMQPLQRYVVKNYILQRCITVPSRISASSRYFGGAMEAEQVLRQVAGWREDHPEPATREIFAFADELTNEYFGTVMEAAQQLALAL